MSQIITKGLLSAKLITQGFYGLTPTGIIGKMCVTISSIVPGVSFSSISPGITLTGTAPGVDFESEACE